MKIKQTNPVDWNFVLLFSSQFNFNADSWMFIQAGDWFGL